MSGSVFGGVISYLFGDNRRHVLDRLAQGHSKEAILTSIDTRRLAVLGKALMFSLDEQAAARPARSLRPLTERVMKPFDDRVSACAILVEIGA